MDEQGDRRPAGTVPAQQPGAKPGGRRAQARFRSLPAATVLAILIALAAGLSWGLLRGILDLGIGLLAVAAVGGWGIGAALRQAAASPAWAGGVAAFAWAAGLVLTWAVSMAILPGSTRTFVERLEVIPFSDWMAPQFGLLEIAGLLVFVGAGLYAVRRPS